MISTERKAELQAAGYFIEDMAKEYGSHWDGEFRWINNDINAYAYQDGPTSDSEEAAWVEADHHARFRAKNTVSDY